MHLFSLYSQGNWLKHTSECTMLPDPHRAHQSFDSRSVHPTNSPIVSLWGNTAVILFYYHNKQHISSVINLNVISLTKNDLFMYHAENSDHSDREISYKQMVETTSPGSLDIGCLSLSLNLVKRMIPVCRTRHLVLPNAFL